MGPFDIRFSIVANIDYKLLFAKPVPNATKNQGLAALPP
jgi:hypothetical protein